MLGRRARRETKEQETQRTSGAERGRRLCGAVRVGKRRKAPEETAMADGAERLTSAIGVPRRAADQPKGSPGGKAATPERSRIKDPQGELETGAARRSGGWWQHRPPFSFWAVFSLSAFLAFPKNTRFAWVGLSFSYHRHAGLVPASTPSRALRAWPGGPRNTSGVTPNGNGVA